MAHAEICPVCMGRGTYATAKPETSTTVTTTERVCHGCGGKGWVTVEAKPKYEITRDPNATYGPWPI
ncbi:MAG: hypothetical protein JEY79_17230 [Pseudodesulfovibrio sp.]|nr:hypothetical protein [Pseudodesulfovibrio sp.]MBI9081471.1 hypothetical protein [Pseudodesulfovibrio sp.]